VPLFLAFGEALPSAIAEWRPKVPYARPSGMRGAVCTAQSDGNGCLPVSITDTGSPADVAVPVAEIMPACGDCLDDWTGQGCCRDVSWSLIADVVM
jgi:hypothetical protein